jgi:hypothetical protein
MSARDGGRPGLGGGAGCLQCQRVRRVGGDLAAPDQQRRQIRAGQLVGRQVQEFRATDLFQNPRSAPLTGVAAARSSRVMIAEYHPAGIGRAGISASRPPSVGEVVRQTGESWRSSFDPVAIPG